MLDLKAHKIIKITDEENHGWMLMEKILFFEDYEEPGSCMFVLEEKKKVALYRLPESTMRYLKEVYVWGN